MFNLRKQLRSQSIKSHITKKKFIFVKAAANSNLNGHMKVFNSTENAFYHG